MKLRVLLCSALLALCGTAFAAAPAPAAGTGVAPAKHEGMCKKDPAKCQAEAAKFDQWCQANADKCTALKARAEKMIEFCSANKQKCEEHRKMMREHMKEWCAKNPDKEHCKTMNGQPGPNDDEDSGDMGPPSTR